MGSPTRIVLEHNSPNGPVVKNVRGSLIASSLQTLRELGHYDRYLALLAPSYRDQVTLVLASSWLPLDLAEAHYQACDGLELDSSSMVEIGEAVAKRIMGTFLGTLMRTGRNLGTALSPWVLFQNYHRICERIIDGGTFVVTEAGPKDAIIDTRGLPLFRFNYFRTATLGLFRGSAGMFAKTCYARELPSRSRRDQMVVSLRWV